MYLPKTYDFYNVGNGKCLHISWAQSWRQSGGWPPYTLCDIGPIEDPEMSKESDEVNICKTCLRKLKAKSNKPFKPTAGTAA